MGNQGQSQNNQPIDTPVVSNHPVDSVENVDNTDAISDGSQFNAYILPSGNDKFCAQSGSDDAFMKVFGTPALYDSQHDGFMNTVFGEQRLDIADARLQAMADVFHTTPEKVAAIMAMAAMKPEEIPPAEQNARCDAAHKECLEAMGNISKGCANAGDLASLLASYSTLNGFAKGSFAQSYVNAAIAAVRQGMAAVAENAAHPSQFSNAEVLHRHLNRFQVDWLEKQRLANSA